MHKKMMKRCLSLILGPMKREELLEIECKRRQAKMLGHREDWGKELPSENSLFGRKSWKKFEKLFLEEMKEVI